MNHSVEHYDTETESPVDVLLGMVSKTADEKYSGMAKTCTIRLPIHEACLLDALAAHSGQSRNKIGTQVIKAGLWALWQQYPSAERQEVEQLAGGLISKAIAESGFEQINELGE